ncbi:MAG: CRISPR-associated helicase Cas3' [Cyanobacteria bacterium]|nr:CRISPR-associated helicase Cas3' [Cyanobacteriota bacterium]
MQQLLAKSRTAGKEPVTLYRHSVHVYTAAKLLFGDSESTALCTQWLHFFGIENNTSKFLLNLKIACLFHDIGKANVGFQRSIKKQGRQLIRHEHLSTIFLLNPEIKNWLEQHNDIFYEGILGAVLGHHFKAAHPSQTLKVLEHRFGYCTNEQTQWEIPFNIRHPDIQKVIHEVVQLLKSQTPDLSKLSESWDNNLINQYINEYKRQNECFKRSFLHHENHLCSENRLLLALKTGVVVSDSLGSAMPRAHVPPEEWVQDFVDQCFQSEYLSPDWIDEKIIRPRQKEVENITGCQFELKDFQQAVSTLGARALLLAGCGSGKTLAAWYWIRQQVNNNPTIRRAIFLYPTRATATEGFRDYVSWAGEDAALLHGTAAYDLQGMFENPDEEDERSQHRYSTSDERLYALGYWNKRAFSATADSFLSFLKNTYRSVCLLPILAESVLVIDEVHAFDSKMFGALEQFLKLFNIPVLCMTASLSNRRQEILTSACGLEMFPKENQNFEELQAEMKHPRYHVKRLENDSPENIALEALRENNKIMCVVNTVDRCQKMARRLTEALAENEYSLKQETFLENSKILCYHSRFRAIDRKKIHETVIQRFKNEPKGLVLVTTQVCEMSLDLDADILITEAAPVSALIQRMGRCCRKIKPGRTGEVWVIEPENEKPYEKEDIEVGKAFIQSLLLKNKPASQRDLADYLEQMDEGSRREMSGKPTLFTHDGLFATPSYEDPFRDTDNYTIDCVLEIDIEKYKVLPNEAKPGYIVPVPRYLSQENSCLPGCLKMAPNTHYSEKFGFHKEEVSDHVRRDPVLII